MEAIVGLAVYLEFFQPSLKEMYLLDTIGFCKKCVGMRAGNRNNYYIFIC
jgi:hypothetical protein